MLCVGDASRTGIWCTVAVQRGRTKDTVESSQDNTVNIKAWLGMTLASAEHLMGWLSPPRGDNNQVTWWTSLTASKLLVEVRLW